MRADVLHTALEGLREIRAGIIALQEANADLTNRLAKLTDAAVRAEGLIGKWYDGTVTTADGRLCGEILSFAIRDFGLVFAEDDAAEAEGGE